MYFKSFKGLGLCFGLFVLQKKQQINRQNNQSITKIIVNNSPSLNSPNFK